jgi:hypothetical protein
MDTKPVKRRQLPASYSNFSEKDTLDGLLAGRGPQAVFANDGLFDELKKASRKR